MGHSLQLGHIIQNHRDVLDISFLSFAGLVGLYIDSYI